MKRIVTLLAVSCMIGSLAGCSKTGEASKGAANDKSKVGTTAGANQNNSTAPASPSTANSQTAPGTSGKAASSDAINLQELPNDMVICTMDKKPVTVGEYRRMFKMQQMEMQNAISNDPNVRARLLAEATKRKIELTADEKTRLLDMSKKNKGSEQDFQKFLKDRHISENDFNKEILDIGIAVKTSDALLQQAMLNDLINRDLLADYAKQNNLASQAMNIYVNVKHSPTYKQLLETTGFNDEELKDELLQTQMAKAMVERIQSRAQVSDRDIAEYYTKNKDKFQHKERIRISQIVIGAPTIDSAGVQSVKTQVLKANPKLSGKDLDTAVQLTEQHQEQHARELLAKAQAPGADFAKLANESTDDVPTKAAKIGGDIGWHEKSQLLPEFANVVWPLKPGQVYPRLVRTPLGFHIVKVTGHEGPGVMPLAEVKPVLKNLLAQQASEKALAQWLSDKRKKVTITLTPKFAALLTASMSQDTAGTTSDASAGKDAAGSKTSALSTSTH